MYDCQKQGQDLKLKCIANSRCSLYDSNARTLAHCPPACSLPPRLPCFHPCTTSLQSLTWHNALFYGSKGGVLCILNAQLAVVKLSLSGSAHLHSQRAHNYLTTSSQQPLSWCSNAERPQKAHCISLFQFAALPKALVAVSLAPALSASIPPAPDSPTKCHQFSLSSFAMFAMLVMPCIDRDRDRDANKPC